MTNERPRLDCLRGLEFGVASMIWICAPSGAGSGKTSWMDCEDDAVELTGRLRLGATLVDD